MSKETYDVLGLKMAENDKYDLIYCQKMLEAICDSLKIERSTLYMDAVTKVKEKSKK